jgi:hypothetical protein
LLNKDYPNAIEDFNKSIKFKSDNANAFAHGGATQYMSYTMADASGNWALSCIGLVPNDMVTATATDLNGNTSEFSLNSDIITSVQNSTSDNEMINVYPNPSCDYMIVSGIGSENAFITLISPDGREVVMPCRMISENTAFVDLNNNKPASGLYFIKTRIGNVIKVVIK